MARENEKHCSDSVAVAGGAHPKSEAARSGSRDEALFACRRVHHPCLLQQQYIVIVEPLDEELQPLLFEVVAATRARICQEVGTQEHVVAEHAQEALRRALYSAL